MIYIIISYLLFIILWIPEIKERTIDVQDILILLLAPILLPIYIIIGLISIIINWGEEDE